MHFLTLWSKVTKWIKDILHLRWVMEGEYEHALSLWSKVTHITSTTVL